MKSNLVLLQSYSSPKPLSADVGVLEVLKKHFPSMKIVYEQTPQVVVFGIKKILKMAAKSNLVSCKDDIIFGWGGFVPIRLAYR